MKLVCKEHMELFMVRLDVYMGGGNALSWRSVEAKVQEEVWRCLLEAGVHQDSSHCLFCCLLLSSSLENSSYWPSSELRAELAGLN